MPEVVHHRRARPRRTPRCRTCAGSAGRSEPPVPRWFHEMTRTPQSGAQQRGPGAGAGAQAVAQQHGRAVDAPSGSLVHARQPGAVVAEDVVEARCSAAGRPGPRRSACPHCAGAAGRGRAGPCRCGPVSARPATATRSTCVPAASERRGTARRRRSSARWRPAPCCATSALRRALLLDSSTVPRGDRADETPRRGALDLRGAAWRHSRRWCGRTAALTLSRR